MRALIVGRSLPASFASAPSRCGRNDSSRSRNRRVSTGASPLLPTATTTGERSTIAGMMKLDSSRSSTTFTGMLRRSACRATQALIACLSVAAIARRTPSRCSGRNSVATCVISPAAARSARPGTSSGAMTRTCAEVRSSRSTLRSATAPPPTTSTGSFGETQKDGEVVHGSCRVPQVAAAAAVRRGSTLSGITRRRGCRPHSRESGFSHHQRPERGSAPGSIARVHGAQPMLG